jgi:hypothetical protein
VYALIAANQAELPEFVATDISLYAKIYLPKVHFLRIGYLT